MINIPVIFILFFLFRELCLQQIFDDNYSTCEYLTRNNLTEIEDQKLQIQNKLWTITGSGRQSGNRILLSPCGDSIHPTLGCDPGAAVCILNSRHPRKSILSAGKYFNYTFDENSSRNILQSIHGQPCTRTENYTVVVQFECSSLTKSTPVYLYKDECELRIEMMKPTCVPACTTRIDGHLVDMRPLQSQGSFVVQELNTKQSFVLSFCRAAGQCGADVLACETTNGGNLAIGSTNWQRITYDPYSNKLVVKSHYGSNKRFRQNIEIHIKCNWNVESIANMQYIVPATQGRKYRFEGESAVACIKLPMNCVIKDSYKNYFVYNLNSLNKQSESWRVENMNSGNIYINICGPLRMSESNSVCNDQYSQVCYVTRTGQHINLGSIPVQFHITTDDTVKGAFVDGSVCAINQNLTYSTEIEFLCNSEEKGPIFQTVDDCTYKIKWETPAACSKHFATSDNCLLSDVSGNINLNSIHAADRTVALTQTSYLRYNLCGPLNRPCNKNENTSICYVKNGQEYVVGVSSKMLTRDNAVISTTLTGDKCNSPSMSKTKLFFRCNHLAPTNGIVGVNMIKDGCLFEMNIDTPLACAPPSFTDCRNYSDNSVFDLSALSLNHSNYKIRDGNSNVLYIINVCRSVINFEDTLCPPGSGVCMYNMTEPHFKYRFLSMGQVNSKSAPVIENGDVVIRYNSGSYCPEAETLKRSTIIRFSCSNREEGARLLKKDSCSHEFIWRTPNACGKQVLSMKTRSTNKACKYTNPQTGKLMDFSNINKLLSIHTDTGDVYKFSLCENNYTHCTSNDTECTTLNTTIELKSNKTNLYLAYLLENSCHTNESVNKLHIYLKCDPLLNNEHINFAGISDCIVHLNLLTNAACTGKESEIDLLQVRKSQVGDEITKDSRTINRQDVDTPVSIQSTISNDPPVIIKTISNITPSQSETSKSILINTLKISKQNGCLVKNNDSNFNIQLKDIRPINVTSSSGNNFTLTFSKPSANCSGYICKNDLQIASEIDECPAIQFNHTLSVIKLSYNSYQICDSGWYHSEVWLKCNSTIELPSVFMESKCSVTVMYPLNDACRLLEQIETQSSNTGIAIGSSVALVILMVIGGVLIAKKRSPNVFSRVYYQAVPENKEKVHIYIKNTTL